jgi:hypothetical protein
MNETHVTAHDWFLLGVVVGVILSLVAAVLAV